MYNVFVWIRWKFVNFAIEKHENMRKIVLLALLCVLAYAGSVNSQTFTAPPGKEIYVPEDLRDNDFTSADSKWSFARMAYTDNVVVFWEKPFGDDLKNPPALEGHDMSVDIDNLLMKIENFYLFFRDNLKFVLPGSKSERYRMMVMLNYSLEGTAYGGDYDGTIGALWIAPNRVKDRTLNCIAHELGHSFQSQVMADGAGEAWGGGGIFEMASQWMLWKVNPNWVSDENYHWQAFCKAFNKRFLSGENIYRSPYVLEYWAMRHGQTVIADLFRNGRRGEDPVSTYMRMFSLSAEQMADEIYDCYSRLVTFDFPRVKENHKAHACQLLTQMDKESRHGSVTLTPQEGQLPETYGFNVVELPLSNNKSKSIRFEALSDNPDCAYRYGIVIVDRNMNACYLPMSSKRTGKLKYSTDRNTSHAYLVVVGCPAKSYNPYLFNPYSQDAQETEVTYPYRVRFGK